MRHPALAAMLIWGAVIASSSSSPGQSGWVWQNPFPQGYDLGGIHAFSSASLLLIGDHSTFLFSSNSGITWQAQPGTNTQFNRVHALRFLEASTALLIADSTVYKSNDGGNKWSQVYTGQVIAWAFADGSRAYLLTKAGQTGTAVLRSLDSGNTWSSQLLPRSITRGCMAFTDSLHGWIFGYQGELFSTSDGGATWTDNGYGSYWGNLALYFFNGQIGWLVGEGANICKTTNGGLSWIRQYTGNDWESLRGVYFRDDSRGWAWGPNLFLRTTNGGLSWFSQSRPIQEDINAVHFADADKGWAVGKRGMILRSTDGGESWNAQSGHLNTSRFNAVQFVSENDGWAAGLTLGTTAGTIYHTSDGGGTWISQSGTLPAEATSISMLDQDSGFVATGSAEKGGAILKSTDKGASWTQVASLQEPLRQLIFTGPRIGWTSGRGKVFKTTDGGGIWSQQQAGFENLTVQSFDFKDSLSGWVLGVSTSEFDSPMNSFIVRTTDGGITWTRYTISSSENLRSVRFLNSRLGWAVGDSGAIYGTTNAGESWILQHRDGSPAGVGLNTVFFTDSLHGWAAGGSGSSQGIALQTTNGGGSWSTYLLCDQSILGLWFFGLKKGWAVGEGGIILNTNSADQVPSGVDPRHTMPEGFCLYQNYPNPFNPFTTIKYTIGGTRDLGPVLSGAEGLGARKTMLVVYDLLGRQVATLVDEMKAPGSYQVRFDGSRLSSGIYFCRMTAGSFSQIRAMVLLK